MVVTLAATYTAWVWRIGQPDTGLFGRGRKRAVFEGYN